MEDQPNMNVPVTPASEPMPAVTPSPVEEPMATSTSSPVSEPMMAPAPAPEAPMAMPAPAPTATDDVKHGKVLAALSYISILWLIPLLFARKSPFAQFHAKQGLMLFVASIVLAIACQLLLQISSVFLFIKGLTGVVILIFAIVGIVKALEGKLWEMPVIGEWAKKLNI